jgi:hypothetical protein
MAYKAEQIEKGGMRWMMTQKTKKHLKKAKQKQMRSVKKEEVPDKSKYEGWAG